MDVAAPVADTLAMAFKIFRFGFSTVVVILLLGVGLFLWSRSKSEPAAWQEQRVEALRRQTVQRRRVGEALHKGRIV